MREVKIGGGIDAFEQGRSSLALQLIPAHVGKFDVGGKRANISGKESQAAEFRGFVAGFIEGLKAEANAKKRHAAGEGLEKRSAKAAFVEGAHERSVMSNAGEKQSLGLGDAFRSLGTDGLRAEALQGALDGSGVAGTVVDESDFHRRPFVLGKTLRRRLSRDTAKRRARAKALNSASIW